MPFVVKDALFAFSPSQHLEPTPKKVTSKKVTSRNQVDAGELSKTDAFFDSQGSNLEKTHRSPLASPN